MKHIERHEFSQAYLVTTLKVHQPDVSNLLKGKISKISITRLIQFAGRLNLDARIRVAAPKAGKSALSLMASTPKAAKGQRGLETASAHA